MIQANELRIGNYILMNGEVVRVGWSLIKDVRDQKKGIETNQNKGSKYDGIPLTPEILEKAGFKKDEEYNCLYLSFGLFQIRTWSDGSVGLSVEEYNCTQIKYAHQLQNIYFALTGGEELNIEL